MIQQLAHNLPVLNNDPIAEGHSENRAAKVVHTSASATGFDTGELSRAIVAGDEAAFSQFYDLYASRLFRLLLVLTSGQEEVARELTQVVMIKVARKFRVFATDEELWAWLAQVARNACIDYFRKQARRAIHTLPASELDALPASVDGAEMTLLESLEQGLQSLEPEDRALLESVYFQGLTHREVADETGQTPKAVESKLARIRAALRKSILIKLQHEGRV